MGTAQGSDPAFPVAKRGKSGPQFRSGGSERWPAIVKRAFWMKNCQDKLDRKIAINRHASFFIHANRCIALDRDERAELFICQLRHSLSEIVDGFAFFAR